MEKSREIAEHATMQSFLNCYLKETGSGKNDRQKKVIRLALKNQGIKLMLPLRYWSETGRHLFEFPLYYGNAEKEDMSELDYVTMVSLLSKELSLSTGQKAAIDELMLRVILSKQNMECFAQARFDDQEKLFGSGTNFLEAEQSLVFGHLLHPTPKSRQGIPEEAAATYSPELEGEFRLHYFRAHSSIVREASSLGESTTVLVKNELKNDPEVDERFKRNYCNDDDDSLIPVHPLQAEFLLKKPEVTKLIQNGDLAYLGPQGKPYAPTSSVRTVYNGNSPFMYKFSLNVKITNSLRVNQVKELERGVEMSRLLQGEIGKALADRYEGFHIVRDPAYITLKGELEELGFEVALRENPFQNEKSEDAMLLAGLCQDNLFGDSTRLAANIRDITQQEHRSMEEVSLDWFGRYLNISLRPIMWLYFTYGIAVEAHQQNSVIQLKNGYPERFFYRDNQGYYFCESTAGRLKEILPDLNEKSDTICADAVADERLRYYFFFNNLFGLINAFGVSGLADEKRLLAQVREVLEEFKEIDRAPSQLLESLLEKRELPCKANLLTRFYDMDELVGSLEAQSVYVNVENPLKKGVPAGYAE